MFIQIVSTLLRVNTTYLLVFLCFCLIIFIYTYFTNTKHQKKLYSKEITLIPDLLKWIIVIIVYAFIMYNLVDLKVNLKSNQSDKIIIVSLWVIFFTFISVFLSIIVIEFDIKRYKKDSKLISLVLSKWSKIAFSMLSMVVVAVAYGFLSNAIMYLYSFSLETQKVTSTQQILYEFYDLDLGIPFVPIFLGLGLIAVLITNKFWIFTMETLIPEKEVVDILLASGNIIRNVYLYKSPIGKYIYVGNNKQHASATQIVAVNKKDIETILFKKEYENFPEKNQIIIQKRKR